MTDSDASGSAPGLDIQLSHLRKQYGSAVALQDIDLRIRAGEFVTLLGPSGSGKTTILNIIAGFVAPDAGDVVVGGRSLLGMPPHRRELGIVFQNYALFPHMSVSGNVAFPLEMRRVARSAIADLVKEALTLVGLQELGDRFPNQLSGGQQQRVAFARAVVFKPRILLMDEPLGALDKKLREQLQRELRRLHQQLGVTFIYVTHDQEEALSMSDRIAVMNNGLVIQFGSTRELYEGPNSEFVAAFLGEGNFLDGVVVRTVGTRLLVRVGDLETLASCDTPTRDTTRVRIYIRPERVRIASGADAYRARVEESTYLGESTRVVLRIGDNVRLVARLPSRAAPFHRGDTVSIGWDPTDLRVVPT